MGVTEENRQAIAIRPLGEDDLASVAALFMRRLGKPHIETLEQACTLLRRTLLHDPWRDEAIPSLVSEARDGSIVGFIGSSVRRVRLDGQPLRAAYASHLVTDPDFTNRTVGLFLLRAFLRGPQDLTLTDSATSQARAMWVALGASPIHHLTTGWLQVMRPASALAALGRYRGGRAARAARAARMASPLADRFAGRLAGDARAPSLPGVTIHALTPETVLRELSQLARPARLVQDYDADFLAWLFDELRRGGARGEPCFRLVRARGAVVGWYIFYLDPGGLCRVLQVMTRERHSDVVIGELYKDAYAGGAAALYGRLEPHTSEAILARGALLRPLPRALVHTGNEDAASALHSGGSVLSWLDGEPW